MQQSSNLLRTVIVTGANKGIGYSIVEKLLQDPTAYDVVLTARNSKLGEEAFNSLSGKYKSSSSQLTFQQLNISDPQSVNEFIEWVKSKRSGKIDVLINNAGFGYLREQPQERLDTININFLETVDLTEKLLPYLAKDGKIIMISSGLGALLHQGQKVQQALSDSTLTKERMLEMTKDLVEKTKSSTATSVGWSRCTYSATKALLNAYTRWVLPKMLKGDQQCYTLAPGWCKTDMGGSSAPLTAEDGAITPVYLVNLPYKADESLNGKYFEKCKVRSW